MAPMDSDETRRVARMQTVSLHDAVPGVLPSLHRVGPYEISSVLGRGGIGIVYKATVIDSCSVPMGTEVALKMLGREHMGDSDRRRFEREAAYLQALRHPGIVRILDIGEYDDRPFLVMELVRGRTLEALLIQSMAKGIDHYLPLEQVVDYLIQALEALHVAHLAGILHRDLKPGNLMVTREGRVKLLDFGLARRPEMDSHLTASGSVLGTPAYMSPEQARGEREGLSIRSDIYSLGALFYELATNRQPFTAENSMALLRRILEDRAPLPRQHRPDLPIDLETIILKAMARETRDRFPTAEAMAEDLRRFQAGMRIRSRRLGWFRLLARQMWAARRMLATIGLITFVVVSLLALTIRRSLQTAEENRHRLQEANAARKREAEELEKKTNRSWLESWRCSGLMATNRPDLRPRRAAIFGQEATILTLPKEAQAPGNVRMTFRLMPGPAPFLAGILINDRDVGQGYCLRFQNEDDKVRATLQRPSLESKRSVELASAVLPSRTAYQVVFSRIDARLCLLIDDQEVIGMNDLTPLEGPANRQAHLYVLNDTVRFVDVLLERQRASELVSRLENANTTMQLGQFDQAIEQYQTFIKDNPDHEDVPLALYRMALCQIGQAQPDPTRPPVEALLREALVALGKVIQQAVGPKAGEVRLAATFQAWRCALRLREFQVADRFLTDLRSGYDLKTLFSQVPEQNLRDICDYYFQQGERELAKAPKIAVDLYRAGAETAGFLRLFDKVPLGYHTAAEILVEPLQRTIGLEAAQALTRRRERARAILNEVMRFKDNLKPEVLLYNRLREAWVCRLLGLNDSARTLYTRIIKEGDGKSSVSLQARLWCGELDFGSSETDALWKAAPDRDQFPRNGPEYILVALMHHLATSGGLFSTDTTQAKELENDIQYFNALVQRKQALDKLCRERLNIIIGQAQGRAAYEWPMPLIRDLLLEMGD